MKANDLSHSRNLFEIIEGKSILECKDKNYYFEHFTVVRMLELEYLSEIDIKKSINSGIKSEKELIDHAIKKGFWSINKEEKLKSLSWTLKKSNSALSKIQDVNQKKFFLQQIKNQEDELKSIKEDRSKITSYSAEHAAEVKKIKRMVDSSVYSNESLTKKEYDEDHEVLITIQLFKKYNELNSKECILNASYHGGFFDLFVAEKSGGMKMIGKNFSTITSFQKNLLILSNALFQKMKNTRIPDEIYGDPVKMIDYEEKEHNDAKVSHGVSDLKAKAKARGGELKAEDFLS
tara:strand:+ start:28322 stop:29194 length:873 start_codon:yes stop_codon:yes gene_type:complete